MAPGQLLSTSMKPACPDSQHKRFADSARLLPGNVTISAVQGSYWSADRESLHPSFKAICVPDSDALNPEFQHMDIIGVSGTPIHDPTATLLLEVCGSCGWCWTRTAEGLQSYRRVILMHHFINFGWPWRYYDNDRRQLPHVHLFACASRLQRTF